MEKFKSIIPHTLWGRAIFLLCLVQGFFWLALAPLLVFARILPRLWAGDFEEEPAGLRLADIFARWAGALISDFSAALADSMAYAAVWLVVYCAFRMARNAAFGGREFFWITAATVFFVAAALVLMYFCWWPFLFAAFSIGAARYLFLKLPAEEPEPAAAYFGRVFAAARRAKFFWACIAAYLLLRFGPLFFLGQ